MTDIFVILFCRSLQSERYSSPVRMTQEVQEEVEEEETNCRKRGWTPVFVCCKFWYSCLVDQSSFITTLNYKQSWLLWNWSLLLCYIICLLEQPTRLRTNDLVIETFDRLSFVRVGSSKTIDIVIYSLWSLRLNISNVKPFLYIVPIFAFLFHECDIFIYLPYTEV